MRALPVFLLFLLLALTGSFQNRVTIVWKGQAESPAIDAWKAELKLRSLDHLVFVDGPVDRRSQAADGDDALAGGARAMIFGAPTTGAATELEIGKTRTPILLYDEASDPRVRVFVGLDREKTEEFLGGATMTEEEPADRDSF